MIVLRRRLLTTGFNRRVAGVVLVSEVVLFSTRLYGALTGVSSLSTAGAELLAFSAVLATSAVIITPRVGAAIPVLVAAIGVLHAYPQAEAIIISSALLVAVGIVMWALSTTRIPRASG